MREQRLLERLARFEQGSSRSYLTRAELLSESIMGYLRRILNTRQGSTPIDPQLGVPDFTNIIGSFTSGSTREMAEEMTQMIRRYEPRLREPRIVPVENRENTLNLIFMLEGTIDVDDREIPLRLTAAVNSQGEVSVER